MPWSRFAWSTFRKTKNLERRRDLSTLYGLRLKSLQAKETYFWPTWMRSWSSAVLCSERGDDVIWASKRFFSLIRLIDNFVDRLWPAKLRFDGGNCANRIAASAIIVDFRHLSFSDEVADLVSLLWIVSSSCNQHLSVQWQQRDLSSQALSS